MGIVSAAVWACALRPEPDPTPVIDPNLPELDASWRPKPWLPNQAESDAGALGSSTSSSGEDPLSKSGQDSGGPTSSTWSQGDVLVTEVMFNPSGSEPATEWIEVYNATSGFVDLAGLAIVDGADRSHTISERVTLAPKQYGVLVRSRSAALAASVPSTSIVYEYGDVATGSGGIQLGNGATGAVYLKSGATTITQAKYGSWPSSGGSSLQLKTLAYVDAMQGTSWCISTTRWATSSDQGTPGAPSDCP